MGSTGRGFYNYSRGADFSDNYRGKMPEGLMAASEDTISIRRFDDFGKPIIFQFFLRAGSLQKTAWSERGSVADVDRVISMWDIDVPEIERKLRNAENA